MSTVSGESRLLTITQAASYLNSRVWAVRKAIARGELTYLVIGRAFLVDRSDLDDFIERRKQVRS